MSVEVGAQYRFTFTVTDANGNLIDPATSLVTVTLPDQSTATPAITRDSLGTFHADYTGVQEGLHKFVVTGTGPVFNRTDYVPFGLFRSIIGIDEARTYIGETDTSRDAILRHVLMSLTEKVESIVGICVQKQFTNDTIIGRNRAVIRLPNGPLPSTSSVTSIASVYPGGPTWLTADLIVYPETATCEPVNFIPFWYGPWRATYTAGRKVVPESIQLALKESLFDFWANQRPYGPDQLAPGMDDTAKWETAIASYDLPAHAKSLLSQYELPGFA